jgi:hypothetical protein
MRTALRLDASSSDNRVVSVSATVQDEAIGEKLGLDDVPRQVVDG